MAGAPLLTLRLLELLQRQALASGGDLALALGVDRRTVRRHITQLEQLGIPVLGIRGRDGGYMLAKGYRLPPMMFTNDEAVALVIGLQAASANGLEGHDASSAAALAKIERVLPEDVGNEMRSLKRTLSRHKRKVKGSTSPRLLALLGGAVDRQQRVELLFGRQGDPVEVRPHDAYGLVNLEAHWYVVGHCHLRGAIRSFRLDRIREIRLLPQSFGRPQNFDALVHLKNSIRDIPRAHRVEILIHGPIERIQRLLHPQIGSLEKRDDCAQLTVEVDDLSWLARELARLPFRIDVSRHQGLKRAWEEHLRLLGTAILVQQ